MAAMRNIKQTRYKIVSGDSIIIKTETVDESYKQFYSSLNPVIQNEDIDPGQFVVKEEPDFESVGFIAEIKAEENDELLSALNLNRPRKRKSRSCAASNSLNYLPEKEKLQADINCNENNNDLSNPLIPSNEEKSYDSVKSRGNYAESQAYFSTETPKNGEIVGGIANMETGINENMKYSMEAHSCEKQSGQSDITDINLTSNSFPLRKFDKTTDSASEVIGTDLKNVAKTLNKSVNKSTDRVFKLKSLSTLMTADEPTVSNIDKQLISLRKKQKFDDTMDTSSGVNGTDLKDVSMTLNESVGEQTDNAIKVKPLSLLTTDRQVVSNVRKQLRSTSVNNVNLTTSDQLNGQKFVFNSITTDNNNTPLSNFNKSDLNESSGITPVLAATPEGSGHPSRRSNSKMSDGRLCLTEERLDTDLSKEPVNASSVECEKKQGTARRVSAQRKRVKALTPKDKQFLMGTYKCHSCDKEFTQLSKWEDHIVQYLNMSGCYPSEILENAKFDRLVYYDNLVVDSDGFYVCSEINCDVKAKHRYDLRRHFTYSHNKLNLKCAICPKILLNYMALHEHLNYVHNPTQTVLKCEFCEYTTIDKYCLRSHTQRRHTKDNYLTCKLCGATKSTRSEMKNHMKLKHTSITCLTKFSCSHCKFQTLYFKCLRRHIEVRHRETIKYFCFYCDHKTNLKETLKKHIFSAHLSETIVRGFSCNRCGMKSHSKLGLQKHIKMSHSEKPDHFLCSFCSVSFTSKDDLFLHKNKEHLSQNEFQCNECKFCGKDRDSFKSHVLKYHLYKFYCFHCPYTCCNKTRISSHINYKHNPFGNRFKCKSCQYVAKNKCLLKQHTNVKHNPNPIIYSCFHCGHNNKIKHKLAQHMQTKHKDILKIKMKKKKNISVNN